MKTHPAMHQLQKGVALVTSLMILVLVTLLALSVVSTSVFEERMAGNTRDRSCAKRRIFFPTQCFLHFRRREGLVGITVI